MDIIISTIKHVQEMYLVFYIHKKCVRIKTKNLGTFLFLPHSLECVCDL